MFSLTQHNGFLDKQEKNIAIFINPYPDTIFVGKMSSGFYLCCITSSALQARFLMEANNMNTDQDSRAGLGSYCL